MFDGIQSPKRRITTREGRTLLRRADAICEAEWQVELAQRRVLRIARHHQRYVAKLNHRLGCRGATGDDLITEWLVQELRIDIPEPGAQGG